jgi:hypothetical protein
MARINLSPLFLNNTGTASSDYEPAAEGKK